MYGNEVVGAPIVSYVMQEPRNISLGISRTACYVLLAKIPIITDIKM